jgi:hypothetical protein
MQIEPLSENLKETDQLRDVDRQKLHFITESVTVRPGLTGFIWLWFNSSGGL